MHRKANAPDSRQGEALIALVRRQLEGMKASSWLVGILLVLAVATALRATVWVSLPLAFAFFIALGVWPVCAWVQVRLPARLRWLGHVVAMSVILVFLSLFFGGIWFASQQIVDAFPTYADDLERLWAKAAAWAQRNGLPKLGTMAQEIAGIETAPQTSTGSNAPEQNDPTDPITSFALMVIGSLSQILTTMVLIFFFVLLMLIEAPVWRDKIVNALGDHGRETTLDSLTAIAQRFRWYLVVRTALGAITGVLYGLWLWAFGIDFVLVWALLAFLLNFVPTIGSLIAGILPILFAFLQKDAGTAVAVTIGILLIEQIMGNYVDPRFQGRQLSISPLVVLVMLLVWAWIWGIPGTLLAVPMTVLITIVCAQIPVLKPLALFLSHERSLNGLERCTRPE